MGAEPAPGTGAVDTAPNVEPDVGPGMGPDVAGGGGILADCEEAGGGTETRTGTGTGAGACSMPRVPAPGVEDTKEWGGSTSFVAPGTAPGIAPVFTPAGALEIRLEFLECPSRAPIRSSSDS